MRQLFQELNRRNVYRVAVAYVTVAFVGFQAAKLLIPSTVLPPWTDEFFLFLLIIGFPVALVVAWAFEMTPEGVRRTGDAEGASESEAMSPEERRTQSRLAMKALVGLGLVGAAVAGGWYLVGGGGEPFSETPTQADTASIEPRADNRSIAVLPFETLSSGEDSETFARGIHDDLLTRLAHISGLKVISRTAVQQYRGTELTTGEVADSLGVRWVMEGAVQVLGDQIQVNAQLIDPRTETHAWADSYREKLTAKDLFALQGKITKRIARSLEAELTRQETRQVERQPTEDLDAYKLYVRGRRRLDTRTETGMRDAVDYFQQAIEQDSSYALAWSGLADAVALFQGRDYASPQDPLPDHEPAARRALELDPELAEAHASMGLVHFQQQNGPAALRELERALELKPSYAQAHHWIGLLLYGLGRLRPAREHISLAVELNPQHRAARAVLIIVLLGEGEVEQAERQLRQQPQDHPRYPGQKSFVLYHAQSWGELETLAWEQLAGEEDPAPLWRFYLARIASGQGDTAAARRHLARIKQGEPTDSRYVFQGLTHVALGEADSAFAAWRELEGGFPLTAFFLRYCCSDLLGPLRDDPRYRKLIERLNQQWGLNPDGSIPDSVDVSFDAKADD